MEEIVLGLSRTVVEGTLMKVKAAIDEEAKLKLSVQSDLVFITGEFEMMQSFLNVTNAERIKNNAVKTWVRQLRDLAYDTEDCIELVVHLDPKPAWWRRLLVLPCLPSVPLPIDVAAAEIKELKDRVEFVSQRNMRYHLITDFGCNNSVLSSMPAKAKDDAAEELANMANPVDICRKLLSNNKCLIVIDDLQSTEEWDTIKQGLSFGKECCVILVTNESTVAKYCSGEDQHVFNVKGLADEHALQIFDKVYELQTNKILRDEDMTKQAKLILNKCGGLPKVIVAIGCFLAKNLNWKALNNNFIKQLENNPELASVHSLFGWLDSYFHNCPDELKPCLFYLSIFPRRHDIRRRRLVRRWIAEGYSRDTDGNLAEVNGEDYFSRLVNLSMLTDAERAVNVAGSGRRMAKCNVNDFFREYIVSRRMEENHVFALEGRCSQPTRRTGRHLVIDKSWDRDENVFSRIEFSRLRSLTVFGPWKSFFASDKMKVLRVLDLEDTESLKNDDVEIIITRLPRIKFLSLRGCKHVFCLPESLGRLRQLETLDVRHTGIPLLPTTVIKLKKLQYVRAGNSSSPGVNSNISASRRTWVSACLSCPPGGGDGVEVPIEIGELTNLHTLGVIKATVAGLKDLKKLTQLRKLGVSGINRRNHKKLRDFVSGHGHLESLSIWLDKDTQGIDTSVHNDDFETPEKLRRLKLHGHVDELPVWIRGLTQLPEMEVSTFPAQDPVLVR